MPNLKVAAWANPMGITFFSKKELSLTRPNSTMKKEMEKGKIN